MVRSGMVRSGLAGLVVHGRERQGLASSGMERLGRVRHRRPGGAGRGSARTAQVVTGLAWQASIVSARIGKDRMGRRGKERRGVAWTGWVTHGRQRWPRKGSVGCVMEWQGLEWPGRRGAAC